jgi:MurNAc alpha-1-phosphate uridylyltransferase
MIKTAMILAAGRGERLKPITNRVPKALCQVQGIPLIERHVHNLSRAGIQRVIINHAYLGGQIRHHLGCGKRWNLEIQYSPEPPGGLETGGGIFNALPLIGDSLFICINADIVTDFNFLNVSISKQNEAHLILVNPPIDKPDGDFGLSDNNLLKNHDRKYTYSGIAYYHPALFKLYQPGRYSVTPLLRKLAERQQISGEVYSGQWYDIGTPEKLLMAQNFKG